MYGLAKPFLFAFDAETAHGLGLKAIEAAYRTGFNPLLASKPKPLPTEAFGLEFSNPVGLAAGLVCLLLGVSQGGQWGWGSGRIVGLFAAAAVILALWWWQQLRGERPLVDLRLVTRPSVGLSHVAALLTGFLP